MDFMQRRHAEDIRERTTYALALETDARDVFADVKRFIEGPGRALKEGPEARRVLQRIEEWTSKHP